MVEDLTFRIRSQYIERIVWIVIILILLIALVIVSVYKTEQCGDDGALDTEEVPEEEQEVPEEPIPQNKPDAPEKPSFTPPPPEVPAGLSGKLDFSIDRLNCRQLTTSDSLTRAKIEGIGMNIENGKSEALLLAVHFYLWEDDDEDSVKETPRTGDDPISVGRVVPGGKFNDFLSIGNKPSTFNEIDKPHYLKVQVLDNGDKIVASTTAKFNFQGNNCKII